MPAKPMPATKTKDSSAANAAEPRAKPCPICGKPAVFAIRPFCSKRCADIDLHRWLNGAYAIPAADADEDTRNKDLPET